MLLKLIQLELELRPPVSAVMGLRIVAHPARPPSAQQGLFAAQAPEPGRTSVLLARLRKLVGEGRSGSAELLDSRAPEAFRMTGFAAENHPGVGAPFKPVVGLSGVVASPASPALRMIRPPRGVAVELCRGAPVALRDDGQRRTVQASSGPWRTSGEWWTHPGFHPSKPNTGLLGTPGWCREEWEVVVHDENEKLENETLRLAHDPANGGWYVIGIYD